jgi:hypothetical protein
MSALHPVIADAIAPFVPTALRRTFATWTLGEGGEQERRDLDAETLAEAVVLATPPVMPATIAKGGFPAFVILETDDTAREGKARHLLHLFTVKVRREWRSIGPAGMRQRAAVPYAVAAGSLPMDAFKPRRPFDSRLDHPGNGRQPGEGQLIELEARR